MGTNIYQHLCTVGEIYEKKSRKELVASELALDFSVWKSSPTANVCVLDSPGFPVELPRMRAPSLLSFSGRHKTAKLCLVIFSLVAQEAWSMQSPVGTSSPER